VNRALNSTLLCFNLLFLVLFPHPSRAQESRDLGTIVVSATKHESSIRNLSTTVTVITAEELQRKGHKTVVEALRDIVSFDISQTGAPGGLSSPQMRGLTGKHMVVMIDGVRVNDPTDANGGVGTLFSHLSTVDIERIEVIRGPQSPLYGSNAGSGVINIITRRGSGKGSMNFSYEGGSLNSHRVSSGFSIERSGLSVNAVHEYSYNEGNLESVRFRNQTSSFKLAYDYKDILTVENLVRYNRVEYNFADFRETFFGPLWTAQLPDPNQELEIDYMVIGNRLTHHVNANWQQELRLGVSWRDRKTLDVNDSLLGYVRSPWDGFTLDWVNFYNQGDKVPVLDEGDGKPYGYKGIFYDLDYRHTFLLSGERFSDVLSLGFEYQFQDYNQWGKYGSLNKNLGTSSVYLHNQALFLDDALSINAGARYDQHQEAGGSTTGLFGVAWDINRAGLILRANVGSSFRAPSVFELFNSDFGNTDLEPETSLSYEFGLEKYMPDNKFRLMLSTWHTKVNDAIVWVMTDPSLFTGHYLNFNKAESDGLEALLELRPHPDWKVGFNYTYTDSRKYDASLGKWSRNVQIPYNKFNLNLTYLYRGATLSLDGYWVDGNRLRWNGVEKMESYFKLDFTARLPLGGPAVGTLRIRNLLDADYVEAVGYREAGINAFGGIELHF